MNRGDHLFPCRDRPIGSLGPIAVGFILASGWTIAQSAGLSPAAYLAAAVCTVLFRKTSMNPLAVMALCGLLGWLGAI